MNLIGVKVAAFMTAPRYECVWARNIIEAALKECKIPLVVSGGVFYGQCMQNMFQTAIREGVEVAVTVDFDSIFTGEALKGLIANAMADPEIDALAALQSRRGSKFPLFTIGEKNRAEFTGKPLKVNTAHFGLTVIKLDRLKDIPRPWFQSVPDANGDWHENKVDDDIYFWREWHKHGRTVYVDSECSIGHMEEMISGFDDDGNHVLQYPNDWIAKNVLAKDKGNVCSASETVETVPAGAPVCA